VRNLSRVAGWAALLALSNIAPALADSSAPAATIESGGRTRAISALDAATLLMQAGRLDDAKKVLLALQKATPNDSQVLFMLAMIYVEQKDYPSAIRLFRRILVREPGVARVRLELARAFFLDRDYDNAERQFRFARAAKLPPAVMANIDHYLYAIRQARRWSYSLSVAVAPDTNLNAGPTISQIDIFGLPFNLSDQTRQHSGVGAAVDMGGDWAAPIGAHTRLHAGLQFHSLTYPNSAYDDMTLAANLGPEFIFRRWDVSPGFTAFRRWYGGKAYNQGVGASLGAIYYVNSRFGVTGSVGGQQISYPLQPSQNGPALSGGLGAFYTPSPVSIVRGNITVTRQSAQLAAYAYTASQLTLGYDRDLPGGFSASIEPGYTRIDYDAALAAFPVVRSDRQWTAQVTLLNRRIDVAGFTPRFLYAFTRNDSDIPLYSFERNRFEIGVTRIF